MSIHGSTFETKEPMLHELLEQIHKGTVQLPDFQRGWVWDDEHIRSLLASISLSYPVGAVMLLETGGEGVRFKPRPVEGVELTSPVEPAKLILDGQQRLTSLYLAIRSGRPVPTRTEKGKDTERFYYFDIAQALNPEVDRVDAIQSVPADRVVRTNFGKDVVVDLSSDEGEWAAEKVPLRIFFDRTAFPTWRNGYLQHHGYAPEKVKLISAFESEIHFRFQQYKIPIIELLRETPKDAVCQVFEKVNTGGVSLTVFELVTATFAAEADDFSLRDDWDARRKRFAERKLLPSVAATDFLAALTLLSSYRQVQAGTRSTVGCKRVDVLRLTLEEYMTHADAIEKGFEMAEKLLARESVFEQRNLPYSSQLVPLAAICAVLGSRFEQDAVKTKLARWYWCGVFGELYGGATETRFGFDVPEVLAWIDGGAEPRTVRDANFQPTRLLSLRTRQSAAYKGITALLLKAGSQDFVSGDSIELTTYFDYAIDIHHIFPKKYCVDHGLPQWKWNSAVNKAPLTARTNRAIGGKAPSKYLAPIDAELGASKVDAILETHLIDPAHLRADDFDAFLRHRAAALLDRIETAMGKAVQGRDAEETVEAFGAPLTPLVS